MDEQKRQQEESEMNETPEYSFLQEVIKDEVGGTGKRKKRILRKIGVGIFIGLVACFTFSVFKPWVESRISGNPDEVMIPRDTKQTAENEADRFGKDGNGQKKDNYSKSVKSLSDVAKKGKRSVVSLLVLTGATIGNKEFVSESQSVSGVLIADNGQELLILGPTMEVGETQQIQATFCDGKKYRVTEKKSDANLELTIYAVKESQLEEKTAKSIRLAALGSSYEVKKGDTTVLLGMLFGQGDAVGYGVLRSSTEKAEWADGTYHILGAELAGFTGGSGIMFNRQGEVIGIICDAAGEDAKEELMHAYAISDIKDVMQFLANGESVPYIGIHATDVSENIAEDRRIPRGIYVDKVEADSPAMRAGIQSGDVLTAIGGTDIENFEQYHELLMEEKEGTHLLIKGYRRGAKDQYVAVHFNATVGNK
ncbi:S1C family serine protease [Dorea sp. AM13-35]|uniref:S1C family serine protease n=1 Tax=Dorea sp. AM13-35 TaxID=2293099 RepID=UPI000E4B5446|nr:S1C family serine protease [Dorea sp. AM13-35]RHO38533.1 serine protease [Dorea sp. AM13-35]